MREPARSAIGYGAFGLVVGFFLYPFVYLAATRARWARPEDLTWAVVFYALIAVPAVVFAVLGWSRGRAADESPEAGTF